MLRFPSFPVIPEAYMDAIATVQPEPEQQPQQPPRATPPWCNCGKCEPMPSEVANVCCRLPICITTTEAFADAVLNGNVLAAAIRANENELPRHIPRANASFRFFAYKQFVLIHHGRLGAGNHVVVPSCVVLRMRLSYPNPDRIYRGFVDGIQD